MVAIAGKIADRHLGVGNGCLDHRFDIVGVHRHPISLPSSVRTRPAIAAAAAEPGADTLAHDRPKCERFGAWIMRNYEALERDLGTNEDVFPAKPGSNFCRPALWMSRSIVLYLSPDHCKAAGS